MPSGRASRRMPARISEWVPRAPLPPVSFTTLITWKPSAGLPIASDLQIVFGFTGSGNSSPLAIARTTGAARGGRPRAAARGPRRPDLPQTRVDPGLERPAGPGRDEGVRIAAAKLLGGL